MKIKILMTAVAALGLCTQAAAQGYFDFGQIPGVPERPNVQVDLSPAMLGFVVAATRVTDPATADVIAGLNGVRVRVYEQLDDARAVADYVDDATGELERDGWERMVFIDDDEEKVRIYLQFADQEVAGMIVMLVDEEEALFVNVAGIINPAQLGQIAATIGIGDVIHPFGISGANIPSSPTGDAPDEPAD